MNRAKINPKNGLIQPKKIQDVRCPRCKELMVRIFPWSPIFIEPTRTFPLCNKCLNEETKKKKKELAKPSLMYKN